MLDKAYAQSVIDKQQAIDRLRRELIQVSNLVLNMSKRAIFSLHRGAWEAAQAHLASARTGLKQGQTMVKAQPRILFEGPWRAAQEEYAEADLFFQYIKQGKIRKVSAVADDPDLFIGAVSDLVGELVRYAVLLASKREQKKVEQIFTDATEVVEFLLQMDLTGALRTKTDQARQHLRKIEEVRYDLSLRQI